MDYQMDSDTDLSTLVQFNDHWNVLKYIRIHKLRESELVLRHGCQLLLTKASVARVMEMIDTSSTNGSISSGSNIVKNDAASTAATTDAVQFSHQYQTTIGYYTVIEQVCLAALDCHQYMVAESCLIQLSKELQLNHSSNASAKIIMDHHHHDDAAVVTEDTTTSIPLSSTSIRYQLLRGRYYEAIGDIGMAQQIYTTLLQHNPSNTVAAKRIYTIVKSQPNHEVQSIESLNEYISTHSSFNDSSIFYELYVQYQNIGQYTYSIYCLQQVLYIMSSIRNADTIHMSQLHCALAECYITSIRSGGVSDDDDNKNVHDTTSTDTSIETTLRLARKHMTLALELHPYSLRAQLGLVVIANRYWMYTETLLEKTTISNSNSSNHGNSKNSTSSKSLANDERLISLTHELNVSKELIRYGTEQIIETTTNRSGTALCAKSMQLSLQALIDEYTEGL
jgi:tetratricopeptide (TPR) repeat protein